MKKYIMAFTREDKTQLELMGFEFYIGQNFGGNVCYVFLNDGQSLNFSNEVKSKYNFTDNLVMCI